MKYFDLHCDTAAVLYNKNTDFSNTDLHINSQALEPFEKARQCFAVCFHDTPKKSEGKNMAYYRAVRKYFDGCLKKEPRIDPIMTVEGGLVIEGDIRNLDELKEMGVRIFGYSWNGQNQLATGNKKDPDAPLTPLGIEVLKKLEEYGIYPDVSHLSDRGVKDMFNHTDMPILATHSNARAVYGHFRNLPDDFLKEIFARGGLVGINLYEAFLSDSPCIEDVLRHVDRMLHTGGEGLICLGGDWDGCTLVKGLRGVEGITKLHDAITRGFSSKMADDIIYNNGCKFFGLKD